MHPKEFYDVVTKPNIAEAIGNEEDYRLAVNAILSVDAAYGVLFEHLKVIQDPILQTVFVGEGEPKELKDNHFKDYIAKQSKEFEIIRDAAYATKHGRLSDRKSGARLVRSPGDVRSRKLVVGLFACGDALGSSAVFIQSTDGEMHRTWYLLRKVEIFTDQLLVDLGI
ncbi:hypothetical protein [Rhizobium rhizogenes]|uniref:Uncharacterized protein n=1 Tax=Rhizobium rhizogenes NBRC 13257 TaxID=1220581 RepID=A0AA87Q5Z1_RHIRH|nr:hypothetical protein [Rhizobium rhizogenes]NTG68234.1 hypothetical protein [Rhizobium rhizogenes]NTI69053.1 hypothetical protein [Rhizobium rhizogenes]TRB12878.1 hypothetical protein EXN67_09410 [Rhizobium rhizogenes]TRB37463.1 hypothetical protein EXN73_30970 [Rhizobium rhizogenes]TRB52249.1 hypothetical protein EXN71_31410 [Rhizobium rhizogenes]